MARTVYYAAMSLDGYISDLDENLEWLTRFDGPGYAGDAEHRGPMESSYPEFMEGVGALVMGSKTYEFILDQKLGVRRDADLGADLARSARGRRGDRPPLRVRLGDSDSTTTR